MRFPSLPHPSFPRHALARAVLVGSLCAGSLPVGAASQEAERTYDLPAAPLEEALSRFAQAAEITLPFDPQQVRGRQAPALHGRYPVGEALALLLAGSGLVAAPGSNGNWLLVPAAEGGVLQLDSLSISGKAPGSTTEGSGSYTTYSSSSSSRLNLSPRETPQSVSVITQQRLEDQKLSSVTDALEASAGITVIREGMGNDADSFWSRGFMINNYEIDGVPTSARLDNYAQSTAMYDRVEIVRGATGLISGLGNPSATINLIRKRPTADFQLDLSAEAGSWDRYGSGLDVSGPLTEGGNVRGRLVVDYKNQHAWVDRYKQESTLLYGISEFDLSDSTLLTLGFSWQDVSSDAPLRSGFPRFYSNGASTDFPRSFNTAPDWSYYNRQQSTLFTSLEHTFDSGWSAKLDVSHARNDYDSEVTYLSGSLDQATGDGAYLLPVKWGGSPQQSNVDAYLTGPFSLFGREHELIAGATYSTFRENSPDYGGWVYPGAGYDGSLQDIFHWHGDAPEPDFAKVGRSEVKEHQRSAYLASRFHLNDDLTLILGSRVTDWQRTSDSKPYGGPTGRTTQAENGVTIPYAGVVYALDDIWSVYASYTEIFNPQGSWVRDINNAPLDPEKGTSYETGLKAAFYDGQLNTSLAVFKAEQDNLAVWNNDTFSYSAQEGVTSRGVEWEANGELAEGWQVAGGYTFTLSEDSDDQRIVTQIPRHSAKLFTTYRLPGALDRLTVGGGVNWQSKSGYTLETSRQDAYSVVNLLARYAIDDHLTASLNLNNAFDKTYYSSTSSYGTYGAPRNLMATLHYRY